MIIPLFLKAAYLIMIATTLIAYTYSCFLKLLHSQIQSHPTCSGSSILIEVSFPLAIFVCAPFEISFKTLVKRLNTLSSCAH